MTFVGAVLVNDHFGHMRMDILPNALKSVSRKVLDSVVSLIVMAVLAILVAGGWAMTLDNLDYRSAALSIPYGWVNAIVPIASLIMFVQTAARLVTTLRGKSEVIGEQEGVL